MILGATEKLLNSEKGSTLLISVLGIATVGVVTGMIFFSRAENMAEVSKTYRSHIDNFEIQHEMEVIFANQSLCKNMVTIQGGTFQINGVYATGTGASTGISTNANMSIRQMSVENATAVAGGTQADFVIYSQPKAKSGIGSSKKNSVRVIYTVNGSGAMTDCRLAISSESACTELGFSWSGSRCGICEELGGTWLGSSCSLVSR